MTTPARVSAHQRRRLTDGWTLAALPPEAAADPAALEAAAPAWQPAQVPGTAATALRAIGAWSINDARDFDADDWWYRCRFRGDAPASGVRRVLRFGGLATLAEVWLNGRSLLTSDNMFVRREVDVTDRLTAGDNELLVRFRSLNRVLGQRRPRPRWKTKLVSHQQLRWIRTTLLGRMPGWSPPVAAVGPWRPVELEERRLVGAVALDLQPSLEDRTGVLSVRVAVEPLGGNAVRGGAVRVGDATAALSRDGAADGAFRGDVRIPDVRGWWPHTHGEPALYPVTAKLETDQGAVEIDAGSTGFRSVELDRGGDGGGFALRVNGAPIFCRGACWTSADIAALDGSPGDLRRWLTLARDGGMNMLRVGGTMIYESDAFFDLCDELGILVWHDAMFANMDYPVGDEAWLTGVRTEVNNFLERVQSHPSLAVVCGNSEVEQQAAMLGLPADQWSNALFQEVLPAACRAATPGAIYWPASPGGGALPFHPNSGVAHYYGVGAYLRPLPDARLSDVRFTSECLGFSNVPDEPAIEAAMRGAPHVTHHPRWKERVPRDTGAGWDFEDVRDHYLREIYGVDPVAQRYSDTPRYLALSRTITGDLMAAAFAEWRRVGSRCRGGLVWYFQDLWPGAGWGVVDALGTPKAAFYALKRAFAKVAVLAIDEGLNGLWLHAVHDGPSELTARLRVRVYRNGETLLAEGAEPVTVAPRSAVAVPVDRVLEGFRDITWAYRFGPRGHDLVVAEIEGEEGGLLAQTCWLPDQRVGAARSDLGLEAAARRSADGRWSISLKTRAFARAVAVDADGFVAEDSYFHMPPDSERTIALAPRPGAAADRPRGVVQALNGDAPVSIVVPA